MGSSTQRPAAGVAVVTDNPERSRYEIHVGGERAGLATYRLSSLHGQPTIAFIHTGVDDKFSGRGLASLLAREALDAARERHLAVLPYCPFIRSWIAGHPGYQDLVPEERRAEFGF